MKNIGTIRNGHTRRVVTDSIIQRCQACYKYKKKNGEHDSQKKAGLGQDRNPTSIPVFRSAEL
jgi:ribosome-binding protein aMBF1 (putative translation factor)